MEKQIIDGLKFYKRIDGYFKSSNGYAHRYVWEKHNGPIPKGFHVHHVDGDKSNNSVKNLEIIERRKHLSEHQNKWIKANPVVARKRTKKAYTAAIKFYSTKKGKEIARARAVKFFSEPKNRKKAREKALLQSSKSPIGQKKCQYCGNIFKYKLWFKRNNFCNKSCWRFFKIK